MISKDYEVSSIKGTKTLVSVLYRQPSGDTNTFIEFVDELLEYASFKRLRLILGGDFNINLLAETTHSKKINKRFD